ncbi:MAG: hypothetical protein HQ567_05720 [Candidatus Nealsonbacteria bacterium]|nr:hypothetical protein [Candidatus Nealsonbacteria bacterium]
MSQFDPYRKWLGIPPQEQPPNHYRLLGIGLFESDPDVISNAADRQMVHVRSFQSGKHSALSQGILNELSAARVCLLDAQRKAAYDQQLRVTMSAAAQSAPSPPPPRSSPPPPQQTLSTPSTSNGAPSFSPSVRSSRRVVRRKKATWQGPAITLALVAVTVGLLAFLLIGRDSDDDKDGQVQDNGSRSSQANNGTGKPRRQVRRPADRPPRQFPQQDPVGQIARLAGHKGPVVEATISSDGRFLLSGGEDGSVRLWQVKDNSLLRCFQAPAEAGEEPAGSVLAVDFSRDDMTVMASRRQTGPPPESFVYLWETGSSAATSKINVTKSGNARRAIFSPDGKLILLACDDGTIRLVDPDSQGEVGLLQSQDGPIRCVAISADGKRVLSGSESGVVRLWDVETRKEIKAMTGHTGPVNCVAFLPGGTRAVSGGADATIRVWEFDLGLQDKDFTGHGDEVTCLDVSPNGRFVISGSGDADRSIRIWRVSDALEVHRFEQHQGAVRSVEYSADGARAVSCGDDGFVRLWGLPNEFDLLAVSEPGQDVPPPVDPVEPEPARKPVPEKALLVKAGKAIREEIFKEDYAATDSASRAKLVDKLLAEGGEPQENDVMVFALLRLAHFEAGKLGLAGKAMAATDELGRRFELDVLDEKVETLEKISTLPASAPVARRQALVRDTLAVVSEAEAADDFDAANRLIVLAEKVVTKARDGVLTKQVKKRAEQVAESKAKYQLVEAALEVLKTKADDPTANETAGRYYCLTKGDWDKGLPMLALAADETLGKLAQADQGNPETTPLLQALGDDWWEAAASQKYNADEQQFMKQRAAGWYKMIVDELSGVIQSQVRRRMAEAADADAPTDQTELPKFTNLECRKQEYRDGLLKALDGNAASEEAVARALQWICKQQAADGSWTFDHKGANPGKLDTAPNAATALALMSLLGAGHGPRQGEYETNVDQGLKYLRNRLAMGRGTLYEISADQMPSHALGTIALCEACSVTQDQSTRRAAQTAVKFIVATQNADGGWGIKPSPPEPEAGPSGVYSTGWNVAALRTAQWAGLQVSRKTLLRAEKYLTSMKVADGSGYRRDPKSDKADATATAVALLSRIYLGAPRDDQELADYAASLAGSGPGTAGEFYPNYYNTQVLRHYGGQHWKTWNPQLRDYLIGIQSTAADEAGSWHVAGKGWSITNGGRLFCTAMATLILESYYRHPALYGPE